MRKIMLIVLVLVFCALIVATAILANIKEKETEAELAKQLEAEEKKFHLVYNRSYNEGWSIRNGLRFVDQGSTGSTFFAIEYEETDDFKLNYFWRLELHSCDNDYVELNAGGRGYQGAVFELDIKSDDVCNFSNVIQFSTRVGKDGEKNDYKLLTVVNNKVYLLQDLLPDSTPAFELVNEWTTLRLFFDYNYEHEPILDTDSDEVKREKAEINKNYFRVYVYYKEYDSDDFTLFTDSPIVIEAKGGKGVSSIRFQSTPNDKVEDFGTGICFDNVKFYDGVTAPIEITPDMGYGSEVDADLPKDFICIGE